jgi:hypothetical protein
MTYITPLTGRSSVYRYRLLTMILAGCALLLLQSSVVQAQWSAPATNINNTNSGTVSIGTTSPGGDKLITAGNILGGNITSHTQLYPGHDSHNNVIMELGYGTATANITPFASLVLSKNLTSANNPVGAISFANSSIANGNEKRIGQISSWTDGATNSGTLRFLTSSANVLNEVMRITSGGNVGIGTAAPGAKLEVQRGDGSDLLIRAWNSSTSSGAAIFRAAASSNGNESARLELTDNTGYNGGISADHTNGLIFRTGNSSSTYAAMGTRMTITTGGSVGIGTTTPLYSLDVNGGTNGFRAKAASSSGNDTIATFESAAGIQAIVRANGYLGIGTISPTARLDVNGNTKVTGNIDVTGTGTGNITASGTITGGTIQAKYQDVAEWVRSSQQLSAGTVVVLDHTKSNQVIASSQAYDTRVAGVISLQPGITLGEQGDNKVLVATTGRVKVKVDATAGPIQVGDLLVTSEKEGVAKKSKPLSLGGVQIHRPGTLIGKALEPLARGTGEILVLLSLQ